MPRRLAPGRTFRDSAPAFDALSVEPSSVAFDVFSQQGKRLSDFDACRLSQRCIRREDSKSIRLLHCLVIRDGIESVSIVGDHLIRAVSSCGSLLEANLVFCKVSNPSVYTWHAVISAHVNHGEAVRALQIYYEAHQYSGLKANRVVYPCILKACAQSGDLKRGILFHCQLIFDRFESDVIIGSSLIDMYSKSGSIEDARKVFEYLPHQNVVTWNAMLTGYIMHSNGLPALELINQMNFEGIQPDKVLYICIIQACTCVGSLDDGRLAHDQIVRADIQLDSILGSTIIDMYSKCGSLADACKVFEDFRNKNMSLVGSMIAAFVCHGEDMHALELFMSLKQTNVNPDKVTFLCLLRACSNIQSSAHGRLFHEHLVHRRMESDVMVANSLMSMYCKCTNLNEARNVFDTLNNRDVVSFGVMMAGYVQHGLFQFALELFGRMESEGINPDEATFVWSLQSSSFDEGSQIHDKVLRNRMEKNPSIIRALIEMYARCKCIKEMDNVFQSFYDRNILLWTAIVAGYVDQGYASRALDMFDKMLEEKIFPDKVTFLSALKACMTGEDIDRGVKIHWQVVTLGLESDSAIGSTLIGMYAKCGRLKEAQNIFNKLPEQNVITWSVLASAYAQSGQISLAFEALGAMRKKGIHPDRVIFLCLLNTSPTIGMITRCKLIHDQIIKHGFYSDIVLGNALIDSYSKCGNIIEARSVFDRLGNRDMVSWCSIITAYAEHGDAISALELFKAMQQESLQPNEVTLLCVIKACYSEEALEEGRLIHHVIIHRGLGTDLVLGSALIDMFSKCGCVDDAYRVFCHLPYHDVVSSTAMMTGFVQNGEDFSALEIFGKMEEKGVQPNTPSYLAALKACSNLGAIVQGRLIHDLIMKSESHSDIYLGNALIDMYGTFGSLKDAFSVFALLPEHDRISWEALIAGLSQQGIVELAKKCFGIMQCKGLVPQDTTYSNVLAACSHGGEIDCGNLFFDSTGNEGEISPQNEHYNCMIDIFGRAGSLGAAEEILLCMPASPDIIGWITLLSACKTHGSVSLGKRCFKHVARHEYGKAAGYALMSSIFNDAQMLEDVNGLYELRNSQGSGKESGRAWIHVENNSSKFIVEDDDCFAYGDHMQMHTDRLSRTMKCKNCNSLVDSVSSPIQTKKEMSKGKGRLSMMHKPQDILSVSHGYESIQAKHAPGVRACCLNDLEEDMSCMDDIVSSQLNITQTRCYSASPID